MAQILTVLGIESSCDDTSAAVVRGRVGAGVGTGIGTGGDILANVVFGQEDLHAPYGGVVPEIAARGHAEKLDLVIEAALAEADTNLTDLDAIAVTAGPGLIGGVLSGVMCAKGLCAVTGLPMVAVNHLAGHALTPRLTDGIAYPFVVLLVSGGHCQFLIAKAHDQFERLGASIDDAPGEAFDKVARMLGLGYPGGPLVEQAAQGADAKRFALPRPLLDREGCDMSFSGLKTAVLRARDCVLDDQGRLHAQDRADLCASFQAAVADVLAQKTKRALALFAAKFPGSALTVAVVGGVAANQAIASRLRAEVAAEGGTLLAPPLKLCTDNAAMIGWAGLEMFASGTRHDHSVQARPRWPLDPSAQPVVGFGKKGAKV